MLTRGNYKKIILTFSHFFCSTKEVLGINDLLFDHTKDKVSNRGSIQYPRSLEFLNALIQTEYERIKGKLNYCFIIFFIILNKILFFILLLCFLNILLIFLTFLFKFFNLKINHNKIIEKDKKEIKNSFTSCLSFFLEYMI